MKITHNGLRWLLVFALLFIPTSAAFALGMADTGVSAPDYTRTDVLLLVACVLLGIEIVDEMDTVEDMQGLARQLWANRIKALGLEIDPAEEKQAKPHTPKVAK
jgi:2-keto-4-pentenoate hydratase